MTQPTISRARTLAMLGSAAALTVPHRASAAPAPAIIRVGAVASDTYAEPFYFAAAGMAEKYGVTLNVTTFTSNAAIGAAVAAGALDVGVADLLMIANGFNRGIPFSVLAAGGEYNPANPNLYICTLKTSPYKTAKDFEGLPIAVPTLVSSIAFTSTKAWFAKNGADTDKLHFSEMPFAVMAAALQRGTVAAAVITEPFLSQIPPDVQRFADPYEAIAKSFLISEWFTLRDFTSRYPNVTQRLVRAIYDTARWANAHQDQTGALLAKAANLDPDKVRAMHRTTYATGFQPTMLEPVLAAAVRLKSIEKPINTADIIETGVYMGTPARAKE